MRIAYLSFSQIPSTSANAFQVVQTCQALGSLGHDLILYAQEGDQRETIESYYGFRPRFEVVYPRRPKLGKMAALWYSVKTVRDVRGRGVQFVYGRNVYALLFAALYLGVPVGLEVHQIPATRRQAFTEAVLLRQASVRLLCATSERLARAYKTRHESVLKERKVVVGYHGGNAPLPASGTTQRLRSKTGSAGGSRLHVGYVGSVYRGKGVEVLQSLAELLPDCMFHVVGDEAGSLECWRENLLWQGHVAPVQLSEYYSEMDVLLLPLQRRSYTKGGRLIAEGMPLKLFQYLAQGRPIVASDLPITREVLEHERNALLVDPSSVDEWVRAIRRLSHDDALFRRLASEAQKDGLERYTWEARARTIAREMWAIVSDR